MKDKRNYGIDLLRIVLMFMVCILHTLGQGGILRNCDVGSLNYKVYWFIEIFSYCAVDSFAIISGYMAINKPRKYEKLVEMWFQVFFYSFIVTLILTIIGVNESWSKLDIIKSLFPVSSERFWYFTAFFVLFLAIPILNKFLFSIDELTAKKVFIIIFILFSCLGLLYDPFKTQSGYSALWLIILYCIGVLAKKIKLFEKKSNIVLFIIWAICIFATWVIHVYMGNSKLINYISPTILLSGLIMVILFSRINLKGTIISKISPLTFGIYLFQLNQIVWVKLIKNSFAFVVSETILKGVVYVFVFATLIFISGLIVEFIRNKIAKYIGIPILSKKIVKIIDYFITKFGLILK